VCYPGSLVGYRFVHEVTSDPLFARFLLDYMTSEAIPARGRHPFVPLPYPPGHEVVGVIETVGSAVDTWTLGQRVTLEPDLPCWRKVLVTVDKR
jgi:Alcohol dehydrogenase GroES-like domain